MIDSVSFEISDADRALMRDCADRAETLGVIGTDIDARISFEMDMTATHANGCPMDFARLLAADDFNFLHDVYGIARHLKRETGELLDMFRPRFAVKNGRAA
ncbi:MAG: hypothetical protein KDJ40_23540 [Hyphomicrobiales bacterium]|nr:hypothetical protein [Hyphomicrobiales bacterium]